MKGCHCRQSENQPFRNKRHYTMLCRKQDIKLFIQKNIVLWYKTNAPASLTPLAALPEEIPEFNAWWWKAEKKNLVSPIGELEQKITRVPLAHHSRLLLLLRLLQTIQEKHLSPPHFQDVLLPIKFSCIPWGILSNGTQKIKDWWDTEKQYRITEKADRTAQGIKAWTSSCRLSGKVDDKHLGEKKS